MNKDLVKTLIKVIVVFLGFEVVSNFFGSIIAAPIYQSFNGKYTLYLASEIAMVLFALILCVILKRVKIFKNKNLNFSKCVFLCVPIVVLSILSLLTNLNNLFSANSGDLISLVLYAICIGIFEEVFFRGIIEGILLDEYGSSNKRIIFSIVLSGIIFGFVHLGNLFAGQDLLSTMIQFFQATAIGVLFGTIYFIGRNIWALIFLHSFYDFCVLLGEVNLVTGCSYSSDVPMSITINSIIISLLISIIYLLFSSRVYKKNNNKDANVKVFDAGIYASICLIAINNVLFSLSGVDVNKYYVCPDYDAVSFNLIETHYYSYDDFTYNDVRYYKDGNKAMAGDKDLGISNVVRVVVQNNNLLIISSEGQYYKLYYSKIKDDGSINLISFEVPIISGVGYLSDVQNNTSYPMIKSITNDVFIIDNNNLKKVVS